jgi:histidine ammonia-lyase
MISLTGDPINLFDLLDSVQFPIKISISEEVRANMNRSRAMVDKVVETGETVYGINTGFGKLSDVRIPDDQVEQLQVNLVRSHACGFGIPLTPQETRALLILRANVLAKGFSGARTECVDKIAEFLEHDILPYVPSRGSVGASGDLAPLAHLAMGLIGEGKARIGEGPFEPISEILSRLDVAPLSLKAKEGLALLNGTQAILSVGGLALAQAMRLCQWANVSGALTLEALMGTPAAFDHRIHDARPHEGQTKVARMIWDLLQDSEIRESHIEGDSRVQDAYSLRCIPQVHGASLDALKHAFSILKIETGSATDNPLIFPDGDLIVSGGNFHGAPLALALDYATIALTNLMNISERRIDRLVDSNLSDGLPAFLCKNPGLESGYMIAHVAAVAALNEARTLSHPACVDNSTTSAAKEDHVSMGMTAALKFKQVLELCAQCIAIELAAAVQGLSFRRPLRTSPGLQVIENWVEGIVPVANEDRSMSEDIEKLARQILSRDPILIR